MKPIGSRYKRESGSVYGSDLTNPDYIVGSNNDAPKKEEPPNKPALKQLAIGVGLSIGLTMLVKGPLGRSVSGYVRSAATSQSGGFVARLAQQASRAGAFVGKKEGSADFLRLFKPMRDIENSIGNKTKPYLAAYESFVAESKNRNWSAPRKLFNFWSRNDIAGTSLKQRALGYAIKSSMDNAAMLPISYAVDRMVNPGGYERPKWYDVKGNIKDFSKFAVADIAFSALPVAGGMVSGRALNIGVNKISRQLSTSASRDFFERVIASSSKVLTKVGRNVEAVKRTKEEIERDPSRFLPVERIGIDKNKYNYRIDTHISKSNIREYVEKLKDIANSFKRHKDEITHQSYKTNISHQEAGLRSKTLQDEILKDINETRSDVDGLTFIKAKYRGHDNKEKTFVEKLFGYQKVKLEDKDVNHLRSQIKSKWKLSDGDANKLFQHGLFVDDLYKADSKFQDFSGIALHTVASRAYNALNKSRYKFASNILGASAGVRKLVARQFSTWDPKFNESEFILPHDSVVNQQNIKAGTVFGQTVKINDQDHLVKSYSYAHGSVFAAIDVNDQNKYIHIADNIAMDYDPGRTIRKKVVSDFAKYKDPEIREHYEKIESIGKFHERVIGNVNKSIVSKFLKKGKYVKDVFNDLVSIDQPQTTDNIVKSVNRFNKLYDNIFSKASDVIDSNKIIDKLDNISPTDNIFRKSPKDVMDSLFNIKSLQPNADQYNIYENRLRKFTAKIREDSREFGMTAEEYVSKNNDILRKARAFVIIDDLNTKGNLAKLDAIKNITSLDPREKTFVDSIELLRNSSSFSNPTPSASSMQQSVKDFSKHKDTIRNIRDIYESEDVWYKKAFKSVKIEDDIEYTYGGNLDYIFTSGDQSKGISDVMGSLSNLFGFGKRLSNMEKTNLTKPYLWYSTATSRIKELAETVGLGPSVPVPNLAHYNMQWLGRRSKQLIGVGIGYAAADAFVDESGLFEGTALDEGLTVYGAEKVAQAQMLMAHARDITGITAMSQYMEGLMPSSSTFLPGAALGAFAARGGGLMAPIMGGLAGGALAQVGRSLGLYEPFKSSEETADELSGRKMVQKKRHRWWMLSIEPFAGEGTEYYAPSYLAKIKAQAEYTPSDGGSKLQSMLFRPLPFVGVNPIGMLFDPYYEERQHYYSKPYPYTGAIFGDVPFVGNAMSVLGRAIKPQVMMHQDIMDQVTKNNDLPIDPSAPHSISSGISGLYHRSTVEMLGLSGYKIEQTLGSRPIGPELEYAAADQDYSLSKKYHSQALGDAAFSGTELIRRFVPVDVTAIQYNPLPNEMEEGFGHNLMEGNPYDKIPEANIRLPGYGYESVHDVRHTFPSRASSLGKSVEDTIKDMAGLEEPDTEELLEASSKGTALHLQLQSLYASQNRLISAEQVVYDVENDIGGHIDAIIQGQNGETIVNEIKTFAGEGLNAPRNKHVHQLNFYLSMMGAKQGRLTYVSRDDPNQVVDFDVMFDPNMLQQDINTLKYSRSRALKLLEQGIGRHTGGSYSYLDRYKILADVAPTSQEYRESELIVQTQIKHGKLDFEEQKEYQYYKQLRNKKLTHFDLYPYRFEGIGSGFSTDSSNIKMVESFSTENTYNAQEQINGMAYINNDNDNPYLKPATEYNIGERAVGRAWELFTHAPTFYNRKFFNQQTPLQHYEDKYVYGDEYRPWTEPYKSWIKPQMQTIRGDSNFLKAMWHGGTMGSIGLGGPLGFVAGAVGGAGLNIATSIQETATDKKYIPEKKRFENQLNIYMDTIEYYKNKLDYDMTGNIESYEAMHNTLKGHRNSKELFKAMPAPEKSYLASFMNTKGERERKRIAETAPSFMVGELINIWNSGERYKYSTNSYDMKVGDASGWSDAVNSKDIKATLVNREGYDLHDFGLAYGMDSLRQTPDVLKNIQESNPVALDGSLKLKPSDIEASLNRIVSQYGRVQISGHNTDIVQIIVE